MKKTAPILLLFVIGYAVIMVPFSGYLRNKPFVEKLGYVPQAKVIKVISADQSLTASAFLMIKVLMYYGSLVEARKAEIKISPDYLAIYQTLKKVLRLDPYNEDAYYFAQAVLTWDVGQVKAVNSVLEYGMKYRTWDWQLPFYAGFNYAYFLKDYKKAAKYYKLAADLSGNPLFARLAGRYMMESDRIDMAIAYLTSMAEKTHNQAVRQSLLTRANAFRRLKKIELARKKFVEKKGREPSDLKELVKGGFIGSIPEDPYGGKFYIDSKNRIRTTSNFSFSGKDRHFEGH